MNRLMMLISAALLLWSVSAGAQRHDRGYDMSHQSSFVKKGTWMVGGTAKYSLFNMDDYSLVVADGINAMGYNLAVSPAFCYMRSDNLGLGMRLEYGRNMAMIDTAAVSIPGLDLGLSVDDFHSINQKFTAKAIMRNYIPIGDSKVFALVNETQLALGWGQSRVVCRQEPGVKGTYAQTASIGLNVCPGMMAFASDHLAVEVSVNMLGLNLSRTEQVHNQVATGRLNSTSVNFRINILSVGFGLYYYL